MLLGVEAVDDLNRIGKVLVGEVPKFAKLLYSTPRNPSFCTLVTYARYWRWRA